MKMILKHQGKCLYLFYKFLKEKKFFFNKMTNSYNTLKNYNYSFSNPGIESSFILEQKPIQNLSILTYNCQDNYPNVENAYPHGEDIYIMVKTPLAVKKEEFQTIEREDYNEIVVPSPKFESDENPEFSLTINKNKIESPALKKKIDLKELAKVLKGKMTKISTSLKSNGKNKNSLLVTLDYTKSYVDKKRIISYSIISTRGNVEKQDFTGPLFEWNALEKNLVLFSPYIEYDFIFFESCGCNLGPLPTSNDYSVNIFLKYKYLETKT